MLGISNGVVHGYLKRAGAVGLAWPLLDGLDDENLELLLFPAQITTAMAERPVPDWSQVERELRRRGVTRMLLWEEYRADHPEGFGYTWFCTTYEAWKSRVRPSMRQTHLGGEKVFVDFAGDTVDVFARLRNQRFFSLAELNGAIGVLVGELNARRMRGFGSSRAELLAEIDAPKLAALPGEAYAFAVWKRCRVAPDYHVEADGHWYSAPYRLLGELVDARITDRTVELFHRGKRIASHALAPNRRGHTTISDHMPSSHRRYAQWNPPGLLAAGEKIGPSTAAFFEAVMADRPHPEHRSCPRLWCSSTGAEPSGRVRSIAL